MSFFKNCTKIVGAICILSLGILATVTFMQFGDTEPQNGLRTGVWTITGEKQTALNQKENLPDIAHLADLASFEVVQSEHGGVAINVILNYRTSPAVTIVGSTEMLPGYIQVDISGEAGARVRVTFIQKDAKLPVEISDGRNLVHAIQ